MGHPFKGLGPAVALLLPFLAGLLVALASWSAWPAVAALFLLLALLSAALRLPAVLTASAAMALCGALSAGRAGLVDPSRAAPFLSEEVVLKGSVPGVRPTETGWVATADDATVSSLDGSRSMRLGKIQFSVRNPDASVAFPSEVRAIGRLYPVRSRGNPGEAPREWAAMAEGIQYAFSADAGKTVFLRGGDAGWSPGRLFRRARDRTGRWIARNAGASDGALYLRSLATGEVPPSSHPMVVLLRKTGLAHILAISGMNVAVFFFLHAFLVRAALWIVRRRHGTPDLSRASTVASLPVCWAYVLMAGAPVSAVRAAGMISAAVLIRDATGARAGGIAWTLLFVATAVVDPFLLVSPSFLLSYGATFFLVVEFGGDGSESPRPPARRALRWARDALVASAVAFLGTLPVSALFFGGLPLGSIAWNVLFGPILGTAGVAGAFLAAVGGAFSIDLLGPVVHAAAQGLDQVLAVLARLSGDGWGYVPLPPAGIAAAACFTAASVAGSLVLRGRGRAAWPALAASAAAFLGWLYLPYAALPDYRLTVTALNVGRGAALVVSFPGGKTMVVDCGSAIHGDAGSRILAPFLRGQGTRKVDILVLTHPHEDHFGGAAALLDGFPVGEIWIADGIPVEAFGDAVAKRAARVRRKSAGDSFSAGGADVVVRPSDAVDRRNGKGPARGSGVNESSLVLEIRHGALSVWLPGDVEHGPDAWGPQVSGERRTRVLFLPHHGSPGAAPDAWTRAAAPAVTVSQNSNCFTRRNLVPSVQDFFLENGAFTIRSDGSEAFCGHNGTPGLREHLWRLR